MGFWVLIEALSFFLRTSRTQRTTKIWVRDKGGDKEEEGLICSTKRRKLAKYIGKDERVWNLPAQKEKYQEKTEEEEEKLAGLTT